MNPFGVDLPSTRGNLGGIRRTNVFVADGRTLATGPPRPERDGSLSQPCGRGSVAQGHVVGDTGEWTTGRLARDRASGARQALGTITRTGRDRASELGPPKADRAQPKATPQLGYSGLIAELTDSGEVGARKHDNREYRRTPRLAECRIGIPHGG